jgi:hypothetical protein
MPPLAFLGALIAGGYWLFGPTGQTPTTTVMSQPTATADAGKTRAQVAVATTRPPPTIVAPMETEAPPPTEIHTGAPMDTQPPATTEDIVPAPAETQAGGARNRQPQSQPAPPQPPAADAGGPAPRAVAIAPQPPVAPTESSQAAAAPAVPATAEKPGLVFVQLASMTTEAGATAEWQRLQNRMPDLLGSRQPDISKDQQHGRTWWRLRTGGFEQAAQATEFCGRVRAKGLNCFVSTAD